MRSTGIVSAAIAAAALVLLAPLTASAAPAAAPRALAHCPNGYVEARYDANIYSGWDSFRVINTVEAGHLRDCNEGYDLGRRYTACGVSNGNGWVRIVLSDGTRGWSPQACFIDR